MRIAIITHVFPPSPHPNAKRPYYYARALHNAGCEVVVYSSHFTHTTDIDTQNFGFKVKRFSDWSSRIDLVRHWPMAYRCAYSAISGLSWPDLFNDWSITVMHAIQADNHFDRIIAFVLPASIPINAIRLGLCDSKWIFDYQESVSPYFQNHPVKSPIKRMRAKRLAVLERNALGKSGKVVFTSDTNRQAYIDGQLVDAGKTRHIPYFYSHDDFSASTEPLGKNVFHIAYFGGFDAHGHRNPNAFLKALALFLQSHPAARVCTKFVFYGNWRIEHNALVDELQLHNEIERHPPCPYSEYLRQIQQHTALLLVVAPEHNLFMPSKVVDYFGAQRPVLGFAPRDSEMWQCLESAGMGKWLVDYHDAAAGAAAIERLWKAHIAGTLHVEPEKLKQWSSEIQIPRILKAVLGEN